MQVFDTLYNKLNIDQRRAVDLIEGPVMVVAGPGTGKTQILTLRIANILRQTDVPPDAILALTFTESGVYSMRKRLVEIMGSDAYRVNIATFHGFCNTVIKNNPEYFEDFLNSKNISTVDRIRLMERVFDKSKLTLLKPYGSPYHYVYPSLNKISELKRENISPKQLRHTIKKNESILKSLPDLYHTKGPHSGKLKTKYKKDFDSIEKLKEIAKVYGMYQEALLEEKYYDYDDMIMICVERMKKYPDLLLLLQEEFLYVLADEHQDANGAQNIILEMLSSFHAPNPNLFIVGDEKQAIFRFQGASLENFLYFKKKYKKAVLIHLTVNYRSTQTILDGAHSLITHAKNGGIEREILTAKYSGKQDPIFLYAFTKSAVEHQFIAMDVIKKIKKGVLPRDIAILYRDNKDAIPISESLTRYNVEHVVESDINILDDEDIRKFLVLLRAVNSFGNDELLAEALHIDFLNVSPIDVYKVIRHASRKKISLYDVCLSKKQLVEAEAVDSNRILKLAEQFSNWAVLAKNSRALVFFEEVLHESGFLHHILSGGRNNALEKIEYLFDEVRSATGDDSSYVIRDFISHLDLVDRYALSIRKRDSSIDENRVRLMTAHGAKGLEFEYVYIVGATEGHWGNRRQRSLIPDIRPLVEGDINDDERRLFYVALTRAKSQVSVTYAQERNDGRHTLPSQFIEEIDKKKIKKISTKKIEKELAKKRPILKKGSKKRKAGKDDIAYFHKLFLDQGLSVTALNNYLTCPWRYFYGNLIRIPRVPTVHQMYGIAVHEALRLFFDDISHERTIDAPLLLSYFDNELSRLPLSETDYKASRVKGDKALLGYFNTYADSWHPRILNEYSIRGVHLTPEVRLTGKLDQIEFINERNVRVYDFKTGKPKSRNVIEGKTKSGNGDYKRQLVFYNLLLNLHASGKFHQQEGVIDYIEPDARGRYKRETFVIHQDEIDELVETIKSVTEEILSLSFWDSRCDDSKCEYCRLRNFIQA